MIRRHEYLEKLNRFRDKQLIKVVTGIRRCGKSTLLEMYKEILLNDGVDTNQIISINLEDLKYSFITDYLSLYNYINDMLVDNKKYYIFIDEVQKYKDIVTKIKFLVEEGSFRYVLSGSLLGVEITNLESAPVGYLSTYEMYPLDFEEFLQITNISEEVIEHLRHSFLNRTLVMGTINEKMLSLFDQYLIVGGMPEAVSKFAATYNVNDILSIHRDIMDLYKLDFTQYETEDKRLILSNIYELVPAELLKQNRRFIVSDIKKGLHFERVESSFLWLKNAGVVLPVYNATDQEYH